MWHFYSPEGALKHFSNFPSGKCRNKNRLLGTPSCPIYPGPHEPEKPWGIQGSCTDARRVQVPCGGFHNLRRPEGHIAECQWTQVMPQIESAGSGLGCACSKCRLMPRLTADFYASCTCNASITNGNPSEINPECWWCSRYRNITVRNSPCFQMNLFISFLCTMPVISYELWRVIKEYCSWWMTLWTKKWLWWGEGRGEAEKVVLLSVHGDPIMKLSSCDKMNEGTPLTPKGWINRTNSISFGSKGIDSFKLPLRTCLLTSL